MEGVVRRRTASLPDGRSKTSNGCAAPEHDPEEGRGLLSRNFRSCIRICIIFAVLFLGMIVITCIQTDYRIHLAVATDTVTGLPSDMYRMLFVFNNPIEIVHDIPSMKADVLANLSGFAPNISDATQKYTFYDSCSAVNGKKIPPQRSMQTGNDEWEAWVEAVGTRHAPFQVASIPDNREEQEFPIYYSNTPCGIHQVQSSRVGPFDAIADDNGLEGSGAALVMELEEEDNLGHSFRAGTMLCTYLWLKQLKEQRQGRRGQHQQSGDEGAWQQQQQQQQQQQPITLLVWWTNEAKKKLKYPETMAFKLEMLRALVGSASGHVEYFDKSTFPLEKKRSNNSISNPPVYSFEYLFEAPWNGRQHQRENFLAQGPLQQKYGEISMRLSMSSVILNRKPLQMFTGLSKRIKSNLKVRDRKKDEGGVLLFQRKMYDVLEVDPAEFHKNAKKMRYLVDSVTGSTEGFLQGLCHKTGLPIKSLDFHPRNPRYHSFREQMQILSNAAILIASHGSGLWNALWIRPGSVVLEVTLRPGHCCMPIPSHMWNKTVCKESCIPYKMVNIADGIQAAGVRWFYYDPLTIDFPSGDSNRATTRVHVNVEHFSKVLLGAYAVATGRNTDKIVKKKKQLLQ